MELKDKIIVITGAASGIGAAMARRFAAEGAKKIVCADRDLAGAQSVADSIGGIAIKTDVSLAEDISNLIETVETDIGPIDLFVSNAGIITSGGVEVDDEVWQNIWDINVLAHIRAARILVPKMLERGGWLFAQHRLSGWAAGANRLRTLFGDQARSGEFGRMAGDNPRRRRIEGLGPLSARGRHADDRWRRHIHCREGRDRVGRACRGYLRRGDRR